MKIKTRCEHCGKVYQMDDNFAGQIAQCRSCQKYFTMTPFEDQPVPGPFRVPGQGPALGQGQAYGQAQASGQTQAFGQGPASGQTQASGQTVIDTQTIACPMCGLTAAIPRVSHKLKLRCQGCGHKFVVKPEPKSRPGRPRPQVKAPREGGFTKTTAILLFILFLTAGLLVAGPKLFPKLLELGWPDILGLLSF